MDSGFGLSPSGVRLHSVKAHIYDGWFIGKVNQTKTALSDAGLRALVATAMRLLGAPDEAVAAFLMSSAEAVLSDLGGPEFDLSVELGLAGHEIAPHTDDTAEMSFLIAANSNTRLQLEEIVVEVVSGPDRGTLRKYTSILLKTPSRYVVEN